MNGQDKENEKRDKESDDEDNGDPSEWGKKQRKPGDEPQKRAIQLNDLVKDEDVKSFYAANVTTASFKAMRHLYRMDDDAVAASETHLSRKETLKMLKSMRKEEKWWAAGASGYRECGQVGLSAGVMMMTKRDRDVLIPHVDDEGITSDPRCISCVLKGDTDIVLKHIYGQVGIGLKGANYEMIRSIAAATNGGRRFVIAMGDYNIKPEILEASGLLEAYGLTIVKPDNVDITCTCGEGSMIDYALVTTNFLGAIVSLKADTTVPWRGHYGLRIRFKMDTEAVKVPEIVRPLAFPKACEKLKEMGLMYEEGEPKDDISWRKAREMIQKRVNDSLSHPNACCAEYAERIGIKEEMDKATRQYAEWSAAAEIRMFAKEGIKVHELTKADHKKYLGRGLPWRTDMVSLDKTAKGHNHRKLEDHAWRLGVSEAFESDMYSMIAEILAQMFLRTSKGIGRERSDMEFLDYILSEKNGNGRESLAGAMAKAAAPRLRPGKEEAHITEVDKEVALAESRQKADLTLRAVARLAGDLMGIAEAEIAAKNMQSIAKTLQYREKERSKEIFATWVTEMLSSSVGKLHRWAKGEDPTGGMSV